MKQSAAFNAFSFPQKHMEPSNVFLRYSSPTFCIEQSILSDTPTDPLGLRHPVPAVNSHTASLIQTKIVTDDDQSY